MDDVFSILYPFPAREIARLERACDFFEGKCNSPVLSAEEEALTDEEFETYFMLTHNDEAPISAKDFSLESEPSEQKVSVEQVLGL